jgi:hypothetical protein
MQPAADGFATDGQLIPTPQEHDDQGTRPTAAEEAEVAWRMTGEPGGDDAGPVGQKSGASAGGLSSQDAEAAVVKALLPARDGAGTGEEDSGDGVPGVAVGQEQEDVGTVANLRVGVMAVQVQQGLALPDHERDTGFHGLVSEVPWLVFAPLTLEPSLLHRQGTAAQRRSNSLSLIRGAI